ncbi:hypothetical protein D9M72_646860 [compost metagenome]
MTPCRTSAEKTSPRAAAGRISATATPVTSANSRALFWSKWRSSRIKSATISSTAVAGAARSLRDWIGLNMPSP